MISKEEIQSLLDYNHIKGLFFWKQTTGRKRKGDYAGSICNGYVRISINGKRYAAHRLAWILIHNEIPESLEIDHINGIKHDNRISNLRLVSHAVNLQNKRNKTGNNKSGYFGVTKRYKRYYASVMVNRKSISLGVFDTPEEAQEAYINGKRKYHEGCTI